MKVSLPPDLGAMIRQQIDSGRYHDAEAVVRDALRQLEARERRLTELRAAVAVAEEQIARGHEQEWTPALHAQILQRAKDAAAAGKQSKADVCP